MVTAAAVVLIVDKKYIRLDHAVGFYFFFFLSLCSPPEHNRRLIRGGVYFEYIYYVQGGFKKKKRYDWLYSTAVVLGYCAPV